MAMNSMFLFPNWPLSKLGDAEDFVELLTLKKIFLNWMLSYLISRRHSINLFLVKS